MSSDDYLITMGGGVSGAIRRAGGAAIALDAAKKTPAKLGGVIVTTAGELSASYVFHAITIGPNPHHLHTADIIARTTRKCLQLMKQLGLGSIAFPAIGAGVAGFDYAEVASRMAEVIFEELRDHPDPTAVSIYLLDRFGKMGEIDFVSFFEEFARRVPLVGTAAILARTAPPTVSRSVQEVVAETQEELSRQRVHQIRKILSELEDQRRRVEDTLLAAMRSGDANGVANARVSLADNEEIRFNYLSELREMSEPVLPLNSAEQRHPFTVFVSSTWIDLQHHRSAIKDVIIKRQLFFRGMEIFGADPGRIPPASKIVNEVRNADVYVGVFGVRYGSVDQASGLSMTELEFREAERSKKPMLLYLLHPDAQVEAKHIESDPASAQKLAALKAYIQEKHTIHQFKNVDELAGQIYIDLGKVRR